MSEPTQTCAACGNYVVVRPTGRGFPPDVAERALAKTCRADGHEPEISYRAGMSPDLMQRLRESVEAAASARIR